MLKSFDNEILLIWHKLRRTNVIEINHWVKVANKTANINVQNRSLYTLVNGVITYTSKTENIKKVDIAEQYIDT